MNINPEILSSVPTHIYKGFKVKVFYSVKEAYNFEGKRCFTIEYLDGEHKNKLGSALLEDLVKI